MSGLIHNSENHRDVPNCSVSVHFVYIVDDEINGVEDGFTVVPDSEVVVKREARSDNSSTYYYNGKKLVFKEVSQRLRKLGIDLDHNRFLILQVGCPPSSGSFERAAPLRDRDIILARSCAYCVEGSGSQYFSCRVRLRRSR